jgi:hypothetical protein
MRDVLRPWTFVAALAAALVLGAPSVALAYRPFDGTDADVAELGELESEIGAGYAFQRGSFAQVLAPAAVLNLGFQRRFELVLEANNVLQQRTAGGVTDGLSETHLFVKALLRRGFLQEEPGVSVALEAGPWLPNINGEQGVGGSAALIVSVPLLGMVLHLNALTAYDLEHHAELFGGVIVEGPKSLVVRPVTEVIAQHAFGGSTTYSALFGGIWKAAPPIDVDLALRASSTDHIPMVLLRVGFTLRTPLWHPQP